MKKFLIISILFLTVSCSSFHTPLRNYRLEKTDSLYNEYNAYYNDLKNRHEAKEISEEEWLKLTEVAKQALENIMAAYQDLARGFSCAGCYEDHMTKAGYRVAILKWKTLR